MRNSLSVLAGAWALTTTLVPVPLVAQSRAARARDLTPACRGASSPVLDRWIGRWYIATHDGRLQGETAVAAAAGGCAIWEEWHGTSGGNGRSLTVFDPTSSARFYLFVNDTGVSVSGIGRSAPSGIEWSVTHFSESRDEPPLERWTWLNDAHLTHRGEISTDGGRSWKRLFEYGFHRWNDSLPPVSRHNGPCRTTIGYRALDYLVGTWVVRDQAERAIGTSTIDTLLDGCAIRERIRLSRGGETLRLVAYDRGANTWRTAEASSSGMAALLGGSAKPAGISFTTSDTVGVVRVERILTRVDEGRLRVRERWSGDAGGTWQTVDLTYERRRTR